LLAAVRDHFQKLIVAPQKQKPRGAGLGDTFKSLCAKAERYVHVTLAVPILHAIVDSGQSKNPANWR
jgi:hypothetical protein